MIEAEPKCFKPHFNALFDFTKHLVFDAFKELSIKEKATEVMVTLVERVPSQIKPHEAKIKTLLEMIVYFMVPFLIDRN